MPIRLVPLLLLVFLFPLRLFAHEFWIDRAAYRIGADQEIVAQLRVGQKFKGVVQRYFPSYITRFEVIRDGRATEVTARLGDDPALRMAALGEGLLVVVHETNDSVLVYSDGEVFREFVRSKGFPELIEVHAERGLPDAEFPEKYRRFAKSLIAAGSGAGADERVGLRTEIVALANPYTDDLGGGLPVQVFYDGAPRANAQVDIFARLDEETVEISQTRTNDDGVAVIPVRPGVEYLIDSVLILPLPNNDPDRGPVWESLWASLTFETPE